jgi:L-lysine 6-transaminase
MEKTALRWDAEQVRAAISRHMLADGMDVVADLDRSRGSRLFDRKSGDYYLDFFGCYATISLGYNHPRMASPDTLAELGRAAVQKPSNSDLYSEEMAQFVDAFGRHAMPETMKYLFFIEGGALAVENALKVAFDWKVRKSLARSGEEKGHKVLHFRQAFHGRSGYTMSLTNTADPRKTQYFPKFDWPRVLNPKCVFPLEGENLERVVQAENEALEQIHRALAESPGHIACLILEPIQGEGGDNHFRVEFHQALRRLCDDNEMLLIHDEVQTGFGATGRMWAHEHYVTPDIVVFGKKSQVCGIMAGRRVDEVPQNVFHTSSRINSTWGGNLVDMVRCRIHLEIYEEERIVERVARMGNVLMRELLALQDEFPELVSNVRGKGLFCALDLPSSEFRHWFRQALFREKVIMLGCGERSVRFRTALNIPEEDLRLGLSKIRRVLESKPDARAPSA